MENTLSYSPAEEGTHTSTLTLKASYKDKASNPVDSTIIINLTGTAIKQPSSLKFMPHLTTLEGDTIFQGQEIAPLFEKIKNLLFQNIRLTEARDRLLPKLMSGEIEV